MAFSVQVQNVSIAFGEGPSALQVLTDVSLNVQPGEFVSIIGPSGCGKSTLLNAIAAQTPYSGVVTVDGTRVRETPPPDIGYLFQRDHLLPWRTLLSNVQMPLEFRGVPEKERTAIAERAIAKVGLYDFRHFLPAKVSGGMLKRAALAQVLTYHPRLLLMDEAFGALDAQTRTLLEAEFYALWREEGQTVLFVTHDLTEAVCLSQRVIVMSARPGRILGDYRVDLPADRDIFEVRFSAAVRELEMRIWESLRREVTLAQALPAAALGRA